MINATEFREQFDTAFELGIHGTPAEIAGRPVESRGADYNVVNRGRLAVHLAFDAGAYGDCHVISVHRRWHFVPDDEPFVWAIGMPVDKENPRYWDTNRGVTSHELVVNRYAGRLAGTQDLQKMSLYLLLFMGVIPRDSKDKPWKLKNMV